MDNRHFTKLCSKCRREIEMIEHIVFNGDKDFDIIICPFCGHDFEIITRGTIEVLSKNIHESIKGD